MSGPGNQTTLLNTVTLNEFVDLVEKEFLTTQEMVPVGKAEALFISADMAAHTGESKRWDEVDTETYAKNMPEGTDAQKAKVGIGYNKTMFVVRRAREIDITFQMRRYNKAPQVTGLLTSLNWFVPQRKNLDVTHRLTFCSSTSYVDMDGETVSTTTGDGVSVVNASHTLAFSSSGFSNRVSGDPAFSKGGLEAAERLAKTNILSNFGEKRVLNFNTIVTGDDPTVVNDVRQFLKSTTDVDQNNPGVINVYLGKYQHVILEQLDTTATGANDSTKRRWWFLVAAGQGINGWQAYVGTWEAANLKTPPAAGNNGEDVHNDNWTFGSRGSYGMCVVRGQGIIGALPTS